MQLRANRTLVTLLTAALVVSGCGGGGDAAATGDVAAPPVDATGQPVSNPSDPAAAAASSGGQPASVPNVSGDDIEGGLSSLTGNDDLFAAKASFDDFAVQEDGAFNDFEDDGSDLPGVQDPSKVGTDPGTDPTSPTPDKDSGPKTTTKVTYGPAKFDLDGQLFQVAEGAAFPKDNQMFTVTAIGKDTVTLELLAGEFSTGSSGVSIDKGETITLVNQDEGINYTLKLVEVKSRSKTTTTGGTGTFPDPASACGLKVCF